MSVVSISYGSLKDASNEASGVAKRLNKYADVLQNTVYKSICNYKGTWTSNMSTAKSKVNDKVSALRAEADRFEKYSTGLIDLKKKCESTDKSVKLKVSSLTATFKNNHGIKNNPVVNAISYVFTAAGNKTFAGRWLGDFKDKGRAGIDYIKDSISNWYEFNGGKDFLKGVAVGTLEILIGVVGVAALIASIVFTGGASLAVIAGGIAGAFGIINGITNNVNEMRAYFATAYMEDPATGKRLSSLDTFSATIRKETDNHVAHGFATGLDIISIAASITSLFCGGASLLKNGYKWATGNPVNVEGLKLRNILTKDNFNLFTGKLKTTFSQGWNDVSRAWNQRDWTFFKTVGKDKWSDFLSVLNGKYADFGDIKTGMESTKNILESSKNFILGGLNLKSAAGVLAPSIPLASLPGEDEFITVGDFTDLFDAGKDLYETISDGKPPFKVDVMEKLSGISDINISTSGNYFPTTSLDTLKTEKE